jgi:hypothetical protein
MERTTRYALAATSTQQHDTHLASAPIRHGGDNEPPGRTLPPRGWIGDDVKISRGSLAWVIAVPLVLTGCAAAYATNHSAPAMSMTAGSSMSPGIAMAP